MQLSTIIPSLLIEYNSNYPDEFVLDTIQIDKYLYNWIKTEKGISLVYKIISLYIKSNILYSTYIISLHLQHSKRVVR